MATPTFRSAGAWSFTANNVASPFTTTPGAPAGTAVGDLLVLICESRSITATVATPAGWTLATGFPKRSGTASGGTIYVFIRIADGTAADTPSPVWSGLTTGTSGDASGAGLLAYQNAQALQDGTVTVSDLSAQTTTTTIPTLTTATDNSLVIGIALKLLESSGQTATVSGRTERADNQTTSGTGHTIEVCDVVQVSHGVTPACTVTWSATTSARALAVSIGLLPGTTAVSSSAGGPLEGPQKLAVPCLGCTIDELQRVAATTQDPADTMVGVVKTTLIRDEAAQCLKVASTEPVAAEQRLAATTGDPFESLLGSSSSPVSQTAQLPLELLQVLARTAGHPSETSQPIASSVLAALESLTGLVATRAAPAETLQTLKLSAQLPSESAARIVQSTGLLADALRAIAQATTLRLAADTSLAAATETPAETLQSAKSSSHSPAAWEQALRASGQLVGESVALLVLLNTLAAESVQTVRQAGQAQTEDLAAAAASRLEPAEQLQSATSSSQLPFEAAGVVLSDVSQSVLLALEALAGVSGGAAAATEATRILGASSQPLLEQLAPAAAAGEGHVDQLAAISAAGTVVFSLLGDPCARVALGLETAGMVAASDTVTFETGGLLFAAAALLLADAALCALRLGDTSDALRLSDAAAVDPILDDR